MDENTYAPKPPALPTALYPDMVILFSAVCGHLCGQSGFLARFCCRGKFRKRLRYKGFRALAAPIVDENTYAPKAGALPTGLHPDIELFYPAGRIHPNRWERRDVAETGTGNS